MQKRVIVRLFIIMLGVFIFCSIVPALLNANSDLSVFIGSVIVVVTIVLGYLNITKIIKFFNSIEEKEND